MTINLTTPEAVAFLLGVPLCLTLVALVVSWRYRLQVQTAMAENSGAGLESTGSDQAESANGSVVPPGLAIRWIHAESDPAEPSGPLYKAIALGQIRQRRNWIFLAVCGAATLHLVLSSIAVVSTLEHVSLWLHLLYAYALALPTLVLCLFAISGSLRVWLVSFLLYTIVGLAFVPMVHRISHLSGFLEVLSEIVGIQILALVFVVSKTMRPIAGFVSALVLFGLLESGILFAFYRSAMISGSLRPGTYPFMSSLVTNILGIFCFISVIRARSMFRRYLGLVAVAAGAFGMEKIWPPLARYADVVEALPFLVLCCALVWLIFRGLKALQSRRIVTSDLLHFYLGWGLLTYFDIGLASSGNHRGLPWRVALAAAAFPILVMVLQFLLWHYSRKLERSPVKRLLLLRVFGRPRAAFTLFELLRDTWRLFGSIDLITGPDLAAWIVTPAMFEAYLRGRVKDLFLKCSEEAEREISRLDRRILSDGRYPINELRCFSNVWRFAVQRVAAHADVVLMDLRGFTNSHRGCVFELTQLLNLLPLARILLLTDKRTDVEALTNVIHHAWANLSTTAPDRSCASPEIQVLVLESLNPAAQKLLASRLLIAAGT